MSKGYTDTRPEASYQLTLDVRPEFKKNITKRIAMKAISPKTALKPFILFLLISCAMVVASTNPAADSSRQAGPATTRGQQSIQSGAGKATAHVSRLARPTGIGLVDPLTLGDAGQQRSNGKSRNQFGKLSPSVPTITATLQDSFTDGDADMKAEPGQTLTYTVNITPSADPAGATGVAYNHSVDNHTSLNAASIRTTPVARPDSYNAIGNVRMMLTTTVTGLLGNDSDADGDTFTASAGATSTNGGEVTVNPDGTFTYNPPRGFEGTDTFTYTLTDSTGKTDTGIVSVVVADVIWFIDNNAGAGGDGRLTAPYNSIATFQAVNNGTGTNPQTDDLIFIYRQTATDYVGSLTLLNDQMVIGQGASQSIIVIGGLTTPSGPNQLPATMGTNPNLTTTAASTNAINVGQNNFIRGVTLGNTTGADIAGTGFMTLTIGPASGVSDVTLNGNGQALNLTNGTLAARIASITSNAAATGILLDQVGGSLLTGSTTVSNATSTAINITDTGAGTSSVNIDFANTSVTSSAGTGVSLTNNTGTITFGDLDISPDNGARALHATNNTGTLTTTSGDLITVNQTSVEIVGTSAGTRTPLNMTLTKVSATASGGNPPNGIILTNTNGPGASVGFVIVGDGANTTVGGNATGGTIANTTGAGDGTPADNAGIGVRLNTVDEVTLRRMQINDHSNFGIYGTSVANFTMEYTTVNAITGTSNGDDENQDEGSVSFLNLSGAASVLKCIIEEGRERNFVVINTTGTLNRIVFDDVTMGFDSTAAGADSILLQAQGGTLNATVQNSDLNGSRGDLFNMDVTSTGVGDLIFTNNNCINTHPATLGGGGGITLSVGGGGTTPACALNFDINGGSFRGARGDAIALLAQVGSATMTGKVRNTAIGLAATDKSGSSEAHGIELRKLGGTTVSVTIDNNIIRQYSNFGILLQQGDNTNGAGGTFSATVTNNNIANPSSLVFIKNGIHLNSGTTGSPDPDDNYTACVDILNNTTAGSGDDGGQDIRVRHRFQTRVNMPGYGGGQYDTSAVQTYLANRNTGAETVSAATSSAGLGYQNGGANCGTPTRPEKSEPDLPEASTASLNVAPPDSSVVAANVSQADSISSASRAVAYAPLSHSLLQTDPGFDQSFFSLLRPATYYGSVNLPSQLAQVGQKKSQKKADSKLAPQGSGGTVSRTIGDIPQNKTVTITYDVVIDDPAGVTQISTQGTVSGSNFSNKLTDDPDTGTANDPTITPIDLVDTTTSVVADDTSVTAGDLVTFTATIARVTGSAGTIAGTVQFKSDGNNLGSPVNVTGSGPFTAQLMTRCLTVGTHTITAVYSGDVNFKTSTGTMLGMQSVVKPPMVQVDDSFAGSTDCQDLGSGNIFNRTAFATIAGGQSGVASGGTVNVAAGTYAENVTVAMDTLSLSGAVQITGNLTLSGGTFNSTSGVLSLTGNFIHNGGTFNNNSGTVALIGSAAQSLGGTLATAFNNLTVNNAAGVSLGIDKSVAGVLTLTSGNINAGAFALSIGAAGSISRTSGHVLGNLKKTFSSTGMFIFTVGTANGYSPVDVNVTAGTGDLTVKAVQGPHPNLTASMSLQRYWTLAGSGITANLVFHYLSTDPMGNEANYRVIRINGGSTLRYPHNPPVSFVDPPNDTANVQGISSFSDWTAGESSSGPTAIQMDSFEATGYDNGVYLSWKSGREVNNLGFNLYREEGGKRVLVNPQPVAGSALVAGSGVVMAAGQSYGWWDSGSARSSDSSGGGGGTGRAAEISPEAVSQYWIEDLDLNGSRTLHGPVLVKQVGGVPPDRSQAAMLSKIGPAREGVTRVVEPAAAGRGVARQVDSIQASLAAKPAVKLLVKRQGLYRVGAQALMGAGLASGVDPRFIQVFVDGRQQPIRVIGEEDGRLDPSDSVEFYGVGADSLYTEARVYWLIAGPGPGMRMGQMKGDGGVASGSSFLQTVERRDRTVYFSSLRNGEQENFFGAVVAGAGKDQIVRVEHADASASSGVTLEVSLQGVTVQSHFVRVQLNGVEVGSVSWEAQQVGVSQIQIAQSQLVEGDNVVRLIPQGGASDVSLVDWIKVRYWHSYTADGDELKLAAAAGQQVSIEGFTTGAVRVLDVTEPEGAVEISPQVQQQKSGYSVSFAASGVGQRRLMVFADNKALAPAEVRANQGSSLRSTGQGADLVIVTTREMKGSFEPLAMVRRSQGLKVMVVEIEDLYDEWSYGVRTPDAIKEFVTYARGNWKVKPRYVLLGGDSSFDPKGYLGYGEWDQVPTKLLDTRYMEAGSDEWLMDMDGDGVGEVASGRLPVRTAAEATAVVGKILGYESGTAGEGVLLVSDSNEGYDFEGAQGRIKPIVVGKARISEIKRGVVDDESTRRQLIEKLREGQKVVSYSGHGSVQLWRGGLMRNEDVGGVSNEGRLPLMVLMTCLNGYFNDAVIDSLGELMVKGGKGGAVAAWASSGMCEPEGQSVMNEEMFRQIFGGSTVGAKTVGEMTQAAKRAVVDVDVRRTWVLIGDPTMRLR
jgi:peptidase C25-like protein/Big-like domain-containing protein